jgi:hypothetical protein
MAVLFSIAATTTAEAQHRHTHQRHARHLTAPIVCDRFGCSDRSHARPAESRRVTDANGNSVVVGRRPPGCPYEFCGCEASLYVFGKIRPYLNLASNWIRKFPRTTPAPGMVAARNHHVMVLMSHAGGSDWLVHDGNSGGHKTREHLQSIKGYVIVDPHGTRMVDKEN